MRVPCEIVVNEFLPLFRAMVASELRVKGQRQSEIAHILGLTQPAISGYLNSPKRISSSVLNIEEIRSTSKWLASSLTEKRITESETIRTICHLCANLKSQGAICAIHKERAPVLRRESCDVCLQLHSGGVESAQAKYEVLKDVRTSVRIIEDSNQFPVIMPEVHVNVVAAIPGAKDIYDVAGIPGRITKIEGRAHAFVPPEFGASTHMAKVLLTVVQKDPRTRAAMNIAYDSDIDKAIRLVGLKSYKFSRAELPTATRDSEAVFQIIKRVLRSKKIMPRVLIDEGGYWVEPISYIFGYSATQVATLAVKIANKVVGLKKSQDNSS
jgi:predicted fused transcriptional regulator/phosphomethylpyrimidine kinase/predicted transcriptional regulator